MDVTPHTPHANGHDSLRLVPPPAEETAVPPTPKQMREYVLGCCQAAGVDYHRLVMAWLPGGEQILCERDEEGGTSRNLVCRPISVRRANRLALQPVPTKSGLVYVETATDLRFAGEGPVQMNFSAAQHFSELPLSGQFDTWLFIAKANAHKQAMADQLQSRILRPQADLAH